jgi:hypothetical protein
MSHKTAQEAQELGLFALFEPLCGYPYVAFPADLAVTSAPGMLAIRSGEGMTEESAAFFFHILALFGTLSLLKVLEPQMRQRRQLVRLTGAAVSPNSPCTS